MLVELTIEKRPAFTLHCTVQSLMILRQPYGRVSILFIDSSSKFLQETAHKTQHQFLQLELTIFDI